MKLLLVTDAVGGVWVYSLELARALRERGFEPVLAVMGPSPSAAQRRQADGIALIDTGLPLDWLDTSPAELRSAGEAIARIAEREGAALVQTCSAAMLADADFAMPVVAVQHSCLASWWQQVRGTTLPPQFAWRRELVACGLERASAVVAPTRAFAELTRRIYDLPGKVAAVHNGRSEKPAPHNQPADFIVTAGRLWDEGKNVALLDAVAARLDVPFQAAGSLRGPNGAHARFSDLDCIGELGQDELGAVLARRPIFASSALYEPFGLSILEAAQAGCALVLSDIATMRELWDGAAIFVDAGDSQGFADTIQRLLSDPAERARRSAAARARAGRYTPGATAARMVEIYEAAAAAAPLEFAGAA